MVQTLNNFFSLLLKLDPQANFLLERLEHKSLTVIISDLDYTISLNIKNNHLHVTNELTNNVLKGKLSYILELIFNKNIQELIIAEKIDYQGSLKDLNEFNRFFKSIDIDIIYKISSMISPEFADLLFKPLYKVKDCLKTVYKEGVIDFRDYLTEERRILISQNEINIFYNEIQELKQVTDRLEAKLKLLQG